MDTSKLLLARQPILDRSQRVVAYELLFRDGADSFARVHDAHRATAELISRALVDIGLDSLVGSLPAWINVSREFLIERHFLALPPGRVVLEVLESVEPDAGVLAALRDARSLGFRVALDDFVLSPRSAGLVREADVIKLDCLGLDREGIARTAGRLARSGKPLLAEKLETRPSFEDALQAGFELFQGFFFARPTPTHGKQLQGDHVALVRLISELNAPDVSVERVGELVQTDVTLSYRLMRYANSAFVGRAVRFTNLRDVITMLGLDRVRACATLLLLGTRSDKPVELAVTALVRARYCELLGTLGGGDRQRHFVSGLFSVLDAYLDEPMEQIAGRLSLASDIEAALVARAGELGLVLDAALACEHADWESQALAGFDPKDLAQAYREAVGWALRTQSALMD